MSWQIARIAAFNDNYIWIVHRDQLAWVVDPGAAAPVRAWLETHQVTLIGILLTHWHADHQGGVDDLLEANPSITVIGSARPLDGPSHPVHEGDVIDVLGLQFCVHETPGHTLDHVCYVCTDPRQGAPIAFTGDTLFAGGCGRLFEGTAADLFTSLARFKHYPDDTQIFCAHEYTLANLRFAVACEPDNAAIQIRFEHTQVMRDQGQATVPSTLGLERQTNPFLRAQSVDDLATRRTWKDRF